MKQSFHLLFLHVDRVFILTFCCCFSLVLDAVRNLIQSENFLSIISMYVCVCVCVCVFVCMHVCMLVRVYVSVCRYNCNTYI